MKGLPMAPGTRTTTRTEGVCPLCDQQRPTRLQLWWRPFRTGLVVAWVVGLGILAAEIWIEGRIIAEQWAMLERVERLMELRSGPVRGR